MSNTNTRNATQIADELAADVVSYIRGDIPRSALDTARASVMRGIRSATVRTDAASIIQMSAMMELAADMATMDPTEREELAERIRTASVHAVSAVESARAASGPAVSEQTAWERRYAVAAMAAEQLAETLAQLHNVDVTTLDVGHIVREFNDAHNDAGSRAMAKAIAATGNGGRKTGPRASFGAGETLWHAHVRHCATANGGTCTVADALAWDSSADGGVNAADESNTGGIAQYWHTASAGGNRRWSAGEDGRPTATYDTDADGEQNAQVFTF